MRRYRVVVKIDLFEEVNGNSELLKTFDRASRSLDSVSCEDVLEYLAEQGAKEIERILRQHVRNLEDLAR